MRKIVFVLLAFLLILISAVSIFKSEEIETSALTKLKEKYSEKYVSSVDHSKFPALQKKFSSPQEITETCISCHNQRHTEVMKSNHWNWEREEYIEGRGIVYIGKKNALNNFCIGIQESEKSCAKCHIGFGLKENELNFDEAKNIDCLVCHDNTETYAKAPEQGGAPDPELDFNLIAQSVGKPNRANCGVCHFFGGGGNNVKHGDLEKSMFEPARDVDVHMGTDASNLDCVDCHTTEKHNISGKMYSLSSMNHNRVTCEQCHSETPHEDNILNEHTIKVACQSCHIPVYAKVNATKTHWDWSEAGKLKDGKPYSEEDADGNHTYLSIKGKFTWGKNLKPDYVWFNGTASHYLLGDTISNPDIPLVLNTLHGSYKDADSKIIPVKIHRAKQPYDPVNKILIQPKLYAEHKGEGGFWKDFDWVKASEEGMKSAKIPFSGNVDFIETEMYWPVNHMVSTKENTVQCSECHSRDNSRLAGLNDFYMPGRDYSLIVETTGKLLLLLTLIGIAVHGSLRIFASVKRKKRGSK